MTNAPAIQLARVGPTGHIRLDRPDALNALDLPMITTMRDALEEWRADDRMRLVIVSGAGNRAFCAGGDIAAVHRSATTDPAIAQELWRAEYQLDACIARYPKPIVTLMDGITMGGGLGIGGHATVRIVTEQAILAMPEVSIGLAPDVGGTLLLSKAPGQAGTHLALTAARIGPADAVYCGLADYTVPSFALCELVNDLTAAHTTIQEVVARHSQPLGCASLALQRPWIDACYGGTETTIEAILHRLRHRPETAARAAAEQLAAAAPTAAKVTLRALRTVGPMTQIEDCLRQDYRVSNRFLSHPDLPEGIRAAILDKDRAPQWNPARLDQVDDDHVRTFFEPLEVELDLP